MRASKISLRIGGLAILCALLLGACNRGPLPTTPLTIDNLPASSFAIRADRDTLLHTPGGATLRIPAGTLQPESGTSAQLVIREAYTIGQMLRGGLVTISGSDILSSGGMISIEPGQGTKRSLRQPITVSIPSSARRGEMQLWSGTADSSGRVDWQDPKSLHNDSAALKTGRTLFNANCASCHNPNKDATGPALGDIVRSHDWEYLRRFTRNPAAVIASGDIEANATWCKWKPTIMTAFPNLSDSELNAIFTYAEMISKPDGKVYPDLKPSVDSCKAYLAKYGLSFEEAASSSGPTADEAPMQADFPSDVVVPEDRPSSSYEFTVRNYGWYNIDAMIKDLPGFENSNVLATFTGARNSGISVYMLMPEDNILLEGGPATSGSGSYAFYRNDGTIPLRHGSTCIVAGVKDSAGQWFFAMNEFRAAASQNLELELRPIRKDSLNAMLDRLVAKNTAAERKRAIDAAGAQRVQNPVSGKMPADPLRPKNIACGCD